MDFQISDEELFPIYVAHPLGQGPEREHNRQRASFWAGYFAEHFRVIPLAPWIHLAEVWPETVVYRSRGLNLDLALLRCFVTSSHSVVGTASGITDAEIGELSYRLPVWACGGKMSPGMQYEANQAALVCDLTWAGSMPPDITTLLKDDRCPEFVRKHARSLPFASAR